MTRLASVLVAWSLAAGLPLGAAPAPSEKPGSFRELLSRRVSVGAVTQGQAFAVALTGRTVAAGPYALEIPGGTGPLTLIFEAPAYEAGRFSSPVRLKNGSGVPLSGIRLDVTGASVAETEAQGAPSQDLAISLPSPLWFGELAPGQESAPVLLVVDVEAPQGVKGLVVVTGLVSGVSVVGDPAEAPDALRAFKSQLRDRTDCTVETLGGLRGEAFGQVAEPIACRVDRSGLIWVVDLSGDPVKQFDARSGFLRALGPFAGSGASDVAFGSGGRLYLFEAGERRGTPVFLRKLLPF